MRKSGEITRDQLVIAIGVNAVLDLEAQNCEPTSRLMPDNDTDTEWVASIHAVDEDNEDVVVEAYYYLTREQMDHMADCDGDGSSVDWVIDHYTIAY